MTRRALVTGIGGFAGRHLAGRLLAEGWDVSGTVRPSTSSVAGFRCFPADVGDLTTLSEAIEVQRPDAVFHLAAVVETTTPRDVIELHRTNVLGTATVLEAIRRVGGVQRVLLASSAFVYGRMAGRVDEDAPTIPLTPYGASKLAAETLALQWSLGSGIDVVVTRAFQHTGPGHRGAYAMAEWADRLVRGDRLLDVGDLSVERDYLDVRDVGAAYLAVMERGHAGGFYNVASGRARSMRTLLNSLLAQIGHDVEVRVDPDRIRRGEARRVVGDITAITRDTGWEPVLDLEATARDLLATARSRSSGEEPSSRLT